MSLDIPPVLLKLLNALEYPFSLNFETQAGLIRLVSWLEDQKIRELEISERDDLRLNNDKWQSVFQNYLCQLSCPFQWSYTCFNQDLNKANESNGTGSSNDDDYSVNIDCIVWLVSYAINMEYEDISEEIVNIEKIPVKNSMMIDSSTIVANKNELMNTDTGDFNDDSNSSDSYNNSSLTSADIDEFGKLLKMPRLLNENDSDYFERLGYRVHLYYSSIAKTALDSNTHMSNSSSGSSSSRGNSSSSNSSSGSSSSSSRGNSSDGSSMEIDTAGDVNTTTIPSSSSSAAAAAIIASSSSTAAAIDWNQFPLGFDTKDAVLNQLAVVLKMLHLDDFRDLQSDLNALIALGQEYTANPRTNTSLGRVGR